jgi:hypothetical protein
MNKEAAIAAAQAMGFRLDYDQWDVAGKGWIRFVLNREELDEKEMRLIWYQADPLESNLRVAANILFRAGQKAKALQITQYANL